MKRTIKLLTVVITLSTILTLTGCPGPVNTIEPPVWDDGVVTTEPTCTTEGVKTYTCSNGETRTETIPALGHDMGDWGEWVVTVQPTTTSVGKKIRTRTCKREGCNHSESWEEAVPMLISNDPSDTSNDDTSNDSEDTNNTTEETQEHRHNYVAGGCDDIECDEHYEFNNEEDYQIEFRIVNNETDMINKMNVVTTLYFSYSKNVSPNEYDYIYLSMQNKPKVNLNDLIKLKEGYTNKKVKYYISTEWEYNGDRELLEKLDTNSPIYIVIE